MLGSRTRSPHDREIAAIALPALGALAAAVRTLGWSLVAGCLAGSMLLAGLGTYVPIALIALAAGWGIQGVWAGLLALMAVRLLTLGARFVGGRWALTGAAVDRSHGRASPARSR